MIVSDVIIPVVNCTKFLGLSLDSKLSWNAYSLELSIKLNKAYYTLRAIRSYVSPKVLISVYFSYFHSLSYGIIFWGSSHITGDIFKIQKRVVRILTNNSRQVSCRPLFKQLKILTLPSQYIYSILIFAAKNRKLFVANRETHGCNTRHNLDLHLPSPHLTVVQKGVLYSGCKIFNSLPIQIKNHIDNLRHFKKNS